MYKKRIMMMKLLPVIYFSIAFCMCHTSWSMDQLNRDIATSETEINRMRRERLAVVMNNSISMDVMIQLDKPI
jgi:hypothetical protein